MRSRPGAQHQSAECSIASCVVLAGTSTGSIWGNGTYFARDARYSNDYARTLASGDKQMMLVDVLVGLSTQGAQDMKVCPLARVTLGTTHWSTGCKTLPSLWSSTFTRPTPPTSSLTTRLRKGRLLRTRRAMDTDTEEVGNRHGSAANCG